MDQINKTDINDISISYVHKKINLISQWVVYISIMRFSSCKVCFSDILFA